MGPHVLEQAVHGTDVPPYDPTHVGRPTGAAQQTPAVHDGLVYGCETSDPGEENPSSALSSVWKKVPYTGQH